jgi:cysteine synthase
LPLASSGKAAGRSWTRSQYTPLVVVDGIWVKLEFLNPFRVDQGADRQVHDRAGGAGRAAAPGDTIVEASSGNAGNAMSMVAALKGYRMLVVMPSGMSGERLAISRAFGAQVMRLGDFHVNDALAKVAELGRQPGYFAPQFDSEWNVEEENRTWLGPETLAQLPGGVVPDAGVGTGGTIVGVGQCFRERNPSCRVVAVEPNESCTPVQFRASGIPGRASSRRMSGQEVTQSSCRPAAGSGAAARSSWLSPSSCRPGPGERSRGRVQVAARMAGEPLTVAAARRDRPASLAASSTLAWTEKTSISRVRVSRRSTCCCGAASSRSPPACRACLRTRASAARPLESMNSKPVRSTIMSRSRAATTESSATTLTATATSSSPRSTTTTWLSHSRGIRSTLHTVGAFLLQHQKHGPGSRLDRRVMLAAEDRVSQRRAVAVGARPADQVLVQVGR